MGNDPLFGMPIPEVASDQSLSTLYRDVNINLEGRGVQMADVHTTQEFKDTHVTLTTVNPYGQQQRQDEEDEEDKLYRDFIINLGRGIQMGDVHTTQEFEDTHVTLTLVNPDGQQQSSSVSSQFMTSMLNPTPNAGIESIFEMTSQMDVQTPTLVAPLPTVNQQLEAKILTRSSNSSKTFYIVAADLSEMEFKKILIEKMEGNKSIHRSNEQRNLYKAFVKVYESNKIILDTYGDTVTLKRCRDDDAEKDEEPSARSDRGSKRRIEGKEPESASAPKGKATRSAGKSTQGSKSRKTSAIESATADEPMQTTFEMEELSHPEFETCAHDQPIVEPSQHPGLTLKVSNIHTICLSLYH
nr:hypothetical protein [Tanacetum cinerariifolium]